jgi:energy-coupling factor transporter ATP-binding protein EcfA2
VEEDYREPRLIQIEGNKKIRVRLGAEVTSKAMNKEDSFILQTGKTIFIWHGNNSGKSKRAKTIEVATKLNQEQGGKGKVIIVGKCFNGYVSF